MSAPSFEPAWEVVLHEAPTVIIPAILNPALAVRGKSVPIGSLIEGDTADADYPPLFITNTWVGSSRPNLLQRDAFCLVEVRGRDEAEVEDLAGLVEAILLASGDQQVGDTWLYRIDMRTGAVSVPDFARQLECVQMTVSVRTRGVVA